MFIRLKACRAKRVIRSFRTGAWFFIHQFCMELLCILSKRWVVTESPARATFVSQFLGVISQQKSAESGTHDVYGKLPSSVFVLTCFFASWSKMLPIFISFAFAGQANLRIVKLTTKLSLYYYDWCHFHFCGLCPCELFAGSPSSGKNLISPGL